MNAAELQGPRQPSGHLVLTPELAFSMEKKGLMHQDPLRPGLMRWGAYHASQDTRFRDFTTGGFPTSSRPEESYFPRGDRNKVIARARVAFRNNPWLSALLMAYVQEIGTPTLKSQTSDDLYNDAKERWFENWAKDCEADHDFSLDEVVEIYGYESCIGGELFVIKRREGWLQLIASEFCGSINTTRQPIAAGSKWADGTAIPAGSTEINGVIRAPAPGYVARPGVATATMIPTGPIIGYRFGSRQDNGAISYALECSTCVQKDYVWHLYDPTRVEQDRGIPLLAPVMNSFQDLFETAEARAQQVKNASCLSLWVTKNLDPYGFAQTMQGALRSGELQNAEELKAIAASRSSYQEIKRGAIYYGATGEDLKLIEPKLNAGDFHDHYIDLLQVCSACLNGMPIEIGLEGFRASNYSSARATVNKWKRNVARIRRRIQQKFLDPLQLWQTRRAQLFGDLNAPPPSPEGTATHNTDENVFWGWPAIPDIDGAKTAAQNTIELANGTTTRERIYADKGEHADEQDKIFAKEKARLLKLLIAAGKEAGLDAAGAQAFAIAQMPTTNPAVVAPLIAAALAEPAPVPAGAA